MSASGSTQNPTGGGAYALGTQPDRSAAAADTTEEPRLQRLEPPPPPPAATGGLIGLLPEALRRKPQALQAAERFEERPEQEVGAAFAVGVVVAFILRKVGS